VNSRQESSKRGAYYKDVQTESAGQRLDNFLLASLRGVPRHHVYRLIRSGQVRVNSGRVGPGYRLQLGDRVRVPPLETSNAPARSIPAQELAWLERRIVYEDARLLVLDKPAGLAVHGGSRIALGCIEALRRLRPDLPSLELVHRLDRATSGCLLVAKKRSTLRALHALLREGRMQKRYLALVQGAWQHGEFEIDVSLMKMHRGAEHIVEADSSGKPARSVFRLIQSFGPLASLVEVTLLTGRTHQIRVHAAHVGHPLAGDERYGDQAFNRVMREVGLGRMFLHAHSVSFAWPDTEEYFSVSVPLPPELGAILDSLAERRSSKRVQPGVAQRSGQPDQR
jgi:23S rRNA pseudouridine955/2504/2580 synthase